MAKRNALTHARLMMYLNDAKTIDFWRRNPVIAAEDLLGIYLSDAQAWVLASSWNTEKAIWSCSRNWGKSFIIAVYCILRALLYPNQNIYIISSVGNQAKETFSKIEEIVLRQGRTSESIPDLKDIAMGETAAGNKNPTGFKHDPSSYTVSFHNGSKIMTLNSKPDNVRGKRANLLVYDECAFVDEELIVATTPFVTQDATAKYGKDAARDKDIMTRQPYNQIIMASSQNTVDVMFYTEYKSCAKRMLAGDKRVFVADMPCDTAMQMYHHGEEIPALLSQSVVDAEMAKNPDKARREYYNKPDLTGGDNQIVSWVTMRRAERQILPYQECRGNKIILAFDPARTNDNSILAAMELVDDSEYGLCGNVIGCTNFVDVASERKFKLDSKLQLEGIHDIIADYNGDNPDFEYIDQILIDSGSGGGGNLYADALLDDWVDHNGKSHHGFIDMTNEMYIPYRSRYPNAVDKLRMISPRKYRTQMVEEFIELMNLGVIRFPYEYNGQEFLQLIDGIDPKTKEEVLKTYQLSQFEMVHLDQIDRMKTEICYIHKSTNAEGTSASYALAREKQNTMHDDRFYVMILMAHRLFELRRGKAMRTSREQAPNSSAFIQFRKPKLF